MQSASTVRLQIESALARKIPSALTPQTRMIRPVVGTGISNLDDLLQGGMPVGALSELTGPECSGRTSVALSFLARITEADKVCAWIDVSNAFDPVSAAAVGVDLRKLLWVRCGASAIGESRTRKRFVLPEKYLIPKVIKKSLHGGGFGPHPRTEVRGLSNAIGDLFAAHNAKPHLPKNSQRENMSSNPVSITPTEKRFPRRAKHYDSIEQGLKSTDLLLQNGGFSSIVLDMGSIAPEFVARIELSIWHRYRLAAERTQSSILLLTQYPCAKSSSELLLRLLPAENLEDEPTVFTGMQPQVEVVRQRFTQTENNVVPLRKSPQAMHGTSWRNSTTWAVQR